VSENGFALMEVQIESTCHKKPCRLGIVTRAFISVAYTYTCRSARECTFSPGLKSWNGLEALCVMR
jgi:hypothetical protein